MELFPRQVEPVIYDLPDAELTYYPAFLEKDFAHKLYDQLYSEIDWQQDDIKIFGKVYAQPRLTALYGDDGKSYTYSGIEMHPTPFTAVLKDLKSKIEAVSGCSFTTVLLNLYRDGADSNGWHSDDEKELGINPVIASLSLGEVRRFHMKHKHNKELKHYIDLESGSLLIMGGKTQHFWKHQLSKTKRDVGPRINLTFRRII